MDYESLDVFKEVLNDLEIELNGEATYNSEQLKKKVKNAIAEVRRARKYPSSYTDEQIQADLYGYYSNIYNIALYDYNQIGAEGEQSHSENGISRSYIDRDKLFAGITPFARF